MNGFRYLSRLLTKHGGAKPHRWAVLPLSAAIVANAAPALDALSPVTMSEPPAPLTAPLPIPENLQPILDKALAVIFDPRTSYAEKMFLLPGVEEPTFQVPVAVLLTGTSEDINTGRKCIFFNQWNGSRENNASVQSFKYCVRPGMKAELRLDTPLR